MHQNRCLILATYGNQRNAYTLNPFFYTLRTKGK
jgi:hypothetical protein